MASDYLQKEITRRQKERAAEIDEIEARMEAMDEAEKKASDLPGRLEALRSVNGTQDAEEILADNTITIAVRSITRRQAFARGRLQGEAKDWLTEHSGAASYEEVDIKNLPDDVGEMWVTMYQGADLLVSLVPEKCKGWSVPSKLEDCLELEDWIFVRALQESWAMNPQFTLAALSGEG